MRFVIPFLLAAVAVTAAPVGERRQLGDLTDFPDPTDVLPSDLSTPDLPFTSPTEDLTDGILKERRQFPDPTDAIPSDFSTPDLPFTSPTEELTDGALKERRQLPDLSDTVPTDSLDAPTGDLPTDNLA